MYDILVNKENILKEEPSYFKLVSTKDMEENDVLVEEETLKNFNELKQDLKSENNIEILLDCAYRSFNEQQQIIDEFISKYGIEYTSKVVAKVGTSEHHTGLAIDLCLEINGNLVSENNDLLQQENIWKIIHSNIHKYGFILRYPRGKEDITGYNYEPWHIRYVGKELAKEIYDKNMTLEEYHLNKNIKNKR